MRTDWEFKGECSGRLSSSAMIGVERGYLYLPLLGIQRLDAEAVNPEKVCGINSMTEWMDSEMQCLTCGLLFSVDMIGGDCLIWIFIPLFDGATVEGNSLFRLLIFTVIVADLGTCSPHTGYKVW